MARLEELYVRRVPEGWTFNATPFTLGAPRVYLLDDAQKDTLVARLRWWRAVAFGLPLVLSIAAIAAYATALHALGVPSPTAAFDAGSLLAWGLVAGGIMAVIGLVLAAVAVATSLMLGPVLAGARRITAPGGVAESLRQQVEIVPAQARAAAAIAFVLLAFGAGWNGVHNLDHRMGSLVMAAVFIVLALSQFTLVLRDRRNAQDSR